MSEVDPKNRDDNTIFKAPNNRTIPSGNEPLFLSEVEFDVNFHSYANQNKNPFSLERFALALFLIASVLQLRNLLG